MRIAPGVRVLCLKSCARSLALVSLLTSCSVGRGISNDSLPDPGPVDNVGSPCTSQLEDDPAFPGFRLDQVSVEINARSCQFNNVCVINHFQGRVSCPYGQLGEGNGPCFTPDAGAVTVLVKPQCFDRQPDQAVYCSCRCANAAGATNDGAAYCGCPAGTECTSLVPSLGAGPDDVAGSYCVKTGTAYNTGAATCIKTCDRGAYTYCH